MAGRAPSGRRRGGRIGIIGVIVILPAPYDDAEPGSQKRILQSLFAKVEVLGRGQLWIHPSDEAEARADSGRSPRGSSARKLVRLVWARGFAPSCLTQAPWCGSHASLMRRPVSEPHDGQADHGRAPV